MSGAWAIVPLLPIIVGVAIVVIIFAAIFSALSYFLYFVVLILVAVMIFKLVSRRNTHFNRQILLQEDIVSVATEMAAKKGVDVSILLNNMDRGVREARLEEAEKNATLWAFLAFSGLGIFYAGYFLMKDFFRHERREDLFVNNMLRTFNALGVPINFPYRNPPIPDRSFALYFVLTLITASIFSVFWVYVLVSDPNNHFRQQMLMEDTIMAQLSTTMAPAPTPAPPPI